jgi:hypothetical protein
MKQAATPVAEHTFFVVPNRLAQIKLQQPPMRNSQQACLSH